MAAKRKTTKKLDKKKKKKWYSIHAPSSFGGAELGESYVAAPENIIGKRIRVNLSNVSKTRNQNVRIKFQVTGVNEEKGITEPVSYEMLANHINRVVRKNKSKIDSSLKLKTKDKAEVTVKAIIITRTKVKGGVLTAVKKEAVNLIEEQVKNSPFSKLLDSIIAYDFQKALKHSLKKITPIQTVEIKFFGK
jgi:small subunit ribosomal protein S3Ae